MKLKIMFGIMLISLMNSYTIEALKGGRPCLECRFLSTVFNCREQTLKLSALVLEHSKNPDVRLLAQMAIDTYNQAQSLVPEVLRLQRQLGCCRQK
jgi:hypothetical protein